MLFHNNARTLAFRKTRDSCPPGRGLFSRGPSAVSQRLGVPGLAGPWGGFRSLLRGSLGRAGPTLEWGRRPPRRTHPAGDSRCLPASVRGLAMVQRACESSRARRPLAIFFVTYRITHLWLNELRSLCCRQPSLVGARLRLSNKRKQL